MLASFVALARLSRLKFLAGGFIGVGLGTAIAAYERGGVDWRAYGVAQTIVSSFQVMTHYANDYFDRECDALAYRTPFSGGSGVLVDGTLPPAFALRSALIAAGCGTLATVALAAYRPAAALIAAAIGALAWLYSAPPARLLARGLGEIDTALVVAVLVPIFAFAAQGLQPNLRIVASTLPGAAAMLAMMLAVEYPDVAADAAGGKRNLVVRLGDRARPLGIAFVALVYGALAAAPALGAPPAFVLLVALSLPAGLALARSFSQRTEPDRDFDGNLAARGVAFFFLVTFFGMLAYLAAPHRAVAALPNRNDRRTSDGLAAVIDTPTLEGRLEAALDEIRPAIRRDGGDVWLVRVADGVAYVQMIGACGGCPMSNATLKDGIERIVRERCPEIATVEQI